MKPFFFFCRACASSLARTSAFLRSFSSCAVNDSVDAASVQRIVIHGTERQYEIKLVYLDLLDGQRRREETGNGEIGRRSGCCSLRWLRRSPAAAASGSSVRQQRQAAASGSSVSAGHSSSRAGAEITCVCALLQSSSSG